MYSRENGSTFEGKRPPTLPTPSYSDATCPRLWDVVPLFCALVGFINVSLSMFETGSDELMELASDLATHFGHEGPTHDIPGTR